MLEQLRHALLQTLAPPRQRSLRFAGPAAPLLGDLGLHLLAEFGQRPQHRPDDLLEDVEAAALMRHARPQLLEHLGVKRRAVRGDAAYAHAAFVRLSLELTQERADVLARRLVIEDA